MPIVACLSDGMASLLFVTSRGGKMTTKSVENKLIYWGLITNSGSWIVLKPNVDDEGETHMDRAVLGAFVRGESFGRKLALDELAALSLKIHTHEFYESMIPIWVMFATGDQRIMNRINDLPALRLYGSLTPDQRQALWAKKKLPLNQLTAYQKDVLYKMIFRGHANIQKDYNQEDFKQPAQEDEEQPFDFHGGFEQEPTELLPDGLPAELTLGVDFELKETIFPVFDQAETDSRNYWENDESSEITSHGLAWSTISKERPDLFPWAANTKLPAKFRKGTQTTISIRIDLKPKHYISKELKDTTFDAKSKIMTLQDLGPEFLKEYEEALKQQREAYKDAKPGEYGGGGGVRNIPPR